MKKEEIVDNELILRLTSLHENKPLPIFIGSFQVEAALERLKKYPFMCAKLKPIDNIFYIQVDDFKAYLIFDCISNDNDRVEYLVTLTYHTSIRYIDDKQTIILRRPCDDGFNMINLEDASSEVIKEISKLIASAMKKNPKTSL